MGEVHRVLVPAQSIQLYMRAHIIHVCTVYISTYTRFRYAPMTWGKYNTSTPMTNIGKIFI